MNWARATSSRQRGALENDGINSISFKISDITKLHELRHSYLHLSDSPDDNFVNQANYEKEDGSFKKRDVLKGKKIL